MEISLLKAFYGVYLSKTCSINGATHRKKTILCYSETRKKILVNVQNITQRIKRWKGSLIKPERAFNQRWTFWLNFERSVETKGGNNDEQRAFIQISGNTTRRDLEGGRDESPPCRIPIQHTPQDQPKIGLGVSGAGICDCGPQLNRLR
jgi:hypothetical protein